MAESTCSLFRQEDFFPLLSTWRQLGIFREQKKETKDEDKIVKEEGGLGTGNRGKDPQDE